jgi:hypothetical protein
MKGQLKLKTMMYNHSSFLLGRGFCVSLYCKSRDVQVVPVGEALEDPCKEKWKLILWHWERERPKKLTGSFRWAEKKFEGKRDVFKRTTSSRSTEPAF